jgi:anti-anti-sigma factor
MRLSVVVQQVGRRAVVKAIGELDFAAAATLTGSIDEAVQAGALEIWLDLGATEFMDSTGLNIVLRLRRRLEGLHRRLAIICPQGSVRRVFELAGMDRALPLYDTLAAAQRHA